MRPPRLGLVGDNSKVSDEWVQVDMLLKHNEENVSMMRELHEMLGYKDRRERSSKVPPRRRRAVERGSSC
eukprot:scaffold396_cov339-Prasinococcus_capsulatus_cf.AAC.4